MPKKKMQYKKMPGSHRQRNRAKHLLKCNPIVDGWYVYGGENGHVVKQIGTELTCDCDVYNKEDKLCSHIIKVQMELNLFPSEPVLVPV